MAVTDNINDLTDEEFTDYIDSLVNGEDAPAEVEVPEELGGEPASEPQTEPEEPEEPAGDEGGKPDVQEEPAEAAPPDERLIRLSDIARAKYPEESADDALSHLLEDMEKEEGASRGVNAEDFRRQAAEAREFGAWREEKAERARAEQEAAEKVREWRADEERLKMMIPSFSLEQAFENEEFKKRVAQNGESVFAAYAAMNPKKEEKKPVDVDEAGLRTIPGGQDFKPADIERMPKKQFDEYIRRIKEGENY